MSVGAIPTPIVPFRGQSFEKDNNNDNLFFFFCSFFILTYYYFGAVNYVNFTLDIPRKA